MPRYLIIDGYNAINKIKQFEDKKDTSLEAARMLFINTLRDFMAQKKTFDKTLVVFDSKQDALGLRRHVYGSVEALFTIEGKDADSVIVDLLKKALPDDKISVSSDDNFVRNHARSFGKDILSISELEQIIMLKKKGAGSKIKEKDLGEDKTRIINEELRKHWGLE